MREALGRPATFEGCDRVRILSFDGGGVRGRYQVELLNRIVKQQEYARLLETVDLLAGTSTGAIIACGLACQMTPGEICELYKELSPQIFGKPRHMIRKCSLWFPKYSMKTLEKSLRKYFKDMTLGDCSMRCLIFSVSLVTRSPRRFYSHDGNDQELSIVDVLKASCAAPTFFSPVTCEYELHVDGGLTCNNPSNEAIEMAMMEKASPNRVSVVSIGNCSHPKPMRRLSALWRPRWTWALPVVNIAMDSSTRLVEEQCDRKATTLGIDYHRIDSNEINVELPLDDHKNAGELLPGLARDKCGGREVRRWLESWFTDNGQGVR